MEQIKARPGRNKELHAWGDLDRDAYRREREALTAELAVFGETTTSRQP